MRIRSAAPIITVALGLLALPHAATAQQPGKVPRIGFLSFGIPLDSPVTEAFRQGLRDLGLFEGKNLRVEWRVAERWAGRPDHLSELAAELVRLKVDVIVATGGPALRAARKETNTIPIVFTFSGDPLGTGLVPSLARPGRNLTGLSFMSPDLSAKRLQLLKEAIPEASRVAAFWNAIEQVYVLELRETQAAAPALGLTIQAFDVRDPNDLGAAFAAMTRERAEALITFAHALTIGNRQRIVDLAAKHRVPAMYGLKEFVDTGGLMSYGPSLPDLYRRAATYVDKILKGAKPADLPVEQPTRFELVVNLRTAKALGLSIPRSVLVRADQVIQ